MSNKFWWNTIMEDMSANHLNMYWRHEEKTPEARLRELLEERRSELLPREGRPPYADRRSGELLLRHEASAEHVEGRHPSDEHRPSSHRQPCRPRGTRLHRRRLQDDRLRAGGLRPAAFSITARSMLSSMRRSVQSTSPTGILDVSISFEKILKWNLVNWNSNSKYLQINVWMLTNTFR